MNEQNTFEHQPIAWTPIAEVIEKARLTEFMRATGAENFDEVYAKSIESPEEFTKNVLDFLKIEFNPPYTKLLDTSGGNEWAKWCVGGGLNITKMCVNRWVQDETTANQAAIIWEGENGEVIEISYSALNTKITLCAVGLLYSGFKKGDAIAIHLPMIVETVIALMAIAKIGAIAVPVFSGYGVDAIASRLNAVGAKGLFTCTGFERRGKFFNAIEIAEQAAAKCPTIEKIFVVEAKNVPLDDKTLKNPKITSWSDLNMAIRKVNSMKMKDRKHIKTYKTEPTLAEDPLIILYTSGTTGKPKGIAHTHCGFPIKAAQDMAFGTDVGVGTRISWVTDIGWMMGPWLIYGALINGATICIYDGAPDYPNADRMWEFCAKHSVEILGISPTLVRALATKGDDLPKKHNLSSLRAFASTGEPWNPAPWWWLFEKVGDSKLPIINYSGGTEISGGILMGNPLLPIKPCSFPAPCLGIDVGILDDTGSDVEKGTVGELCIGKPWIGMARGFWQEPERYIETYWSRFEGVWVHGDWAMQDADGHFYILGRSDDTLKVAGKRVGPAEVESLLVAHDAVIEAAVIGVPDDIKGTKMIAFCVVNNQTETLETELKALVAKDMGKPLAPSSVYFVAALPKTRNAKVMRRVIRAAFLGEDAGDLSALENPHSIEEIRNAASVA